MPINISLNTRTIIGKVKQRSQLCLIYTEDGREVLVELAVLKGCICDENKLSAWVIDQNNLVQDEETGLWMQILDERSIIPIPVITGKSENKELQKLVDQIFVDSVNVDLITMNEEQRKDKQRSWMYLIFGTPIILSALILGLKVIK